MIQSQFFSSNFFSECLTKSLVSAANPIVNLGLKELCFEMFDNISIFFSKNKFRLSFFLFFDFDNF